MILHHGDLRTAALQAAAAASSYFYPLHPFSRDRRRWHLAAVDPRGGSRRPILRPISASSSHRPIAAATDAAAGEIKKPDVCTADELHYVPVPGTEWRIALWRYLPPPEAPKRNHPLMLLSGVGTNAIGYDLSPGASFARHMSSQGFDTWIVEVRGAGLSMRTVNSEEIDHSTEKPASSNLDYVDDSTNVLSGQQSAVNSTPVSDTEITVTNETKKELATLDESQLVMKLSATFLRLAERLSGYLNEGLLEARQSSAVAGQIKELSKRLVNIVEEGQRSVSPQIFDLQERLSATIEDFQKQLDLIVIYDWDFDNYLEEDVPAAMEYIKQQTNTPDGKLLSIGHSMGGILLYAMLSKCSSEGIKSGLAAVVTLASSVDYTSSKSSLKLLVPLADPAQALSVPVVPLGALLAAAYPLASRPPYVLSWLSPQVSAQDMMHPELFEKLLLKNFCTIPAKVILQLTTAFREGGLRNRAGTFCYKDHLHKCDVPVLAVAADEDLICPPEAVYETVKLFPRHIFTYKIMGKPGGPHYGHYDLVGGRMAADEVYPCIIEFLSDHDKMSSG